jgi:hypothetical protein
VGHVERREDPGLSSLHTSVDLVLMEAFQADCVEQCLNEVEAFNVLSRARMDALEVQLTNVVSFHAQVRETEAEQDRRIGHLLSKWSLI